MRGVGKLWFQYYAFSILRFHLPKIFGILLLIKSHYSASLQMSDEFLKSFFNLKKGDNLAISVFSLYYKIWEFSSILLIFYFWIGVRFWFFKQSFIYLGFIYVIHVNRYEFRWTCYPPTSESHVEMCLGGNPFTWQHQGYMFSILMLGLDHFKDPVLKHHKPPPTASLVGEFFILRKNLFYNKKEKLYI